MVRKEIGPLNKKSLCCVENSYVYVAQTLRLGPAFVEGRLKSLSMVNKAGIESQNGTSARLVNVLIVGV